MKRVLVTGGTGLVGFNIIQSLLQRGYKVKALVRDLDKGRRLLPESCELVQGDVCVPETLSAAFFNCEWVFHAAGFPEQWMKDTDVFQKINVQGTANMVSAALAAGVERFMYTSTIDVFHGQAGREYDESVIDPDLKDTFYERSKQRADKLVVSAMARGLPAVFLHPSGLYGPGPTDSPGMNDFFMKLSKKQVPMLLPGGLPLVYGPDVGDGHVLAAEKAVIGERFILSESYWSLETLAKTVLRELDPARRTPPVMPMFVAKTVSALGEGLAQLINKPPLIPKGQLTFLQWQAIPRGKKAQQKLDWQPTPFKDGLVNTLEYLLEHDVVIE